MRSSSWDENSVPFALGKRVSQDTVLFKEPLSQFLIQIDLLVVNRIGIWLQLFALFQGDPIEHVSNLVSVSGMENVPNGSYSDTGFTSSLSGQQVAVRLVHCL